MFYGKIGVEKGGLLTIAAFGAGCLAMFSKVLIWPGLILLAVGMGTVTTLMSLLGRELFGSRDYAAIWSIVMMASSLSVMIVSPGWGRVYDTTGSYRSGMVGMCLLLVAAMALHAVLVRHIKKMH